MMTTFAWKGFRLMENESYNLNAERGKYIIAVALYGTVGFLLRYVQMPSEAVALCRGVFGSSFLWVYCKITGHRFDGASIRRNLKWLLLSGVFLGLNWIFLFAAYIETTVAVASLCNYMAPILVILAAPLLLKEPLNKRKLPFVLLALIGIVLISGVTRSGAGSLNGVLLGLAAALTFAGVVICNRKITGLSPMDKAVVQLLVSAVTILPYVIVHYQAGSYSFDARSIIIVLILGLVHTGFAYCLYFSGMKTLPVQTVAILGYLEPVISVLCSVFFLHEALPPEGWVGAVLILAAALISEIL